MTPQQFATRIKRDMEKLEARVDASIRRTSKQAVRIVRKNVPIAFGELRDSTHQEDRGFTGEIAATVVGAPHATAVEVGSRPHLVPLDVLVRWVKLRGAQGLSGSGRVRTMRWKASGMGTTTAGHARSVASQLKSRENGGSLSVDAPLQIAKAIQGAILKHGTRPQWYALNSMPEIMTLLDTNITGALG